MWTFSLLLGETVNVDVLISFFHASESQPLPEFASPNSVAVSVQVVDPVWLSLPGAEVTVKPLRGDTQLKSNRTETDKDGYARFFVPSDADYSVLHKNS
jgi:hypothetical protein